MEAVDGLLEAVAADEPHGVVGAAVGVGAQAIDRDDAGVLQPAGDLGLEQEARAAGRVVGVVVEDLLEGHLAVAARRRGRRRRRPGRRGRGAAGRGTAGRRRWPCRRRSWPCGRGRRRGRVGVATWVRVALDVGVADGGQALAGGSAGGDGGQAPLDVAAVLLQVQGDHRLDAGALLGVEVRRGR